MKNGQCPKCQSTEIYRGTPLAGEGSVHLAAFPRNTFVNILVDAYVCRNCGYIEMYVADSSKGKLDAMAQDSKNWQKAG